ncbi:MAG: PHP domain-containing protein [Cyanobacteria bacterium MAG CAR2_bin_4]|nr:PHP domain-containing protein [Cyanobacteria bacterium MAG CAR2_bin_4]
MRSSRPSPRAPDAGSLPHPLVKVLAMIDRHSCPGRCNFHCHTTCSDGSLTPEELAVQAAELGLEHLAVTDHHSQRAYPLAQQTLAALQRQGQAVPRLWRGVEISALLKGCLVHVLALGYGAEEPLMPYLQGEAVRGKALQAGAVVSAVHRAGGLAALAHPARYRLDFRVLIRAAQGLKFDAVETWYDYDMGPWWQPSPLICDHVDQLRQDLGLLASCGTDTHGANLRGR